MTDQGRIPTADEHDRQIASIIRRAAHNGRMVRSSYRALKEAEGDR